MTAERKVQATSAPTIEALKETAERTLKDAAAQEIMRWVGERFQDRVGVSCSFGGAGGIVLAHMAKEWAPQSKILFVDTDFLFPQTYQLRRRLEREWDLHIEAATPVLTPEEQNVAFGEALWETDPDLCCHLRKVLPMADLLEKVDCWVTALRRDQSSTRAGTEVFEVHRVGDRHTLLKVNPLVHWSRQDVWAYINERKLPYNPLLDKGYSSLGCTHCTRPSSGVDERSGRWPGKNKTECGLHTFTRRSH